MEFTNINDVDNIEQIGPKLESLCKVLGIHHTDTDIALAIIAKNEACQWNDIPEEHLVKNIMIKGMPYHTARYCTLCGQVRLMPDAIMEFPNGISIPMGTVQEFSLVEVQHGKR